MDANCDFSISMTDVSRDFIHVIIIINNNNIIVLHINFVLNLQFLLYYLYTAFWAIYPVILLLSVILCDLGIVTRVVFTSHPLSMRNPIHIVFEVSSSLKLALELGRLASPTWSWSYRLN